LNAEWRMTEDSKERSISINFNQLNIHLFLTLSSQMASEVLEYSARKLYGKWTALGLALS